MKKQHSDLMFRSQVRSFIMHNVQYPSFNAILEMGHAQYENLAPFFEVEDFTLIALKQTKA